MTELQKLVDWATTQGVVLHGIKPQMLPGRGTGIVAVDSITAGQVVLSVPATTFRSKETVPKSLAKKVVAHGPISTKGLLALDVLLDTSPEFAIWKEAFPSREDFWENSPLLWSEDVQNLLPKVARTRLDAQKSEFYADWKIVQQVKDVQTVACPPVSSSSAAMVPSLGEVTKDDFLYAWLLLSTRVFYHMSPTMKKYREVDRIALQPVVDMFNHADHGCEVSFANGRFLVKADRDYARGEELLFCYGGHSNDTLLVDYGFVLSTNCWDEVRIDEVVEAFVTDPSSRRSSNGSSPQQRKEWLQEHGFWGRYCIDATAAGCYRTQVALRTLSCRTEGQWRRFVGGMDDGATTQKQTDALLYDALEDYEKVVSRTLRQVETIATRGAAEQQDALTMACAWLTKRWQQIGTLVRETKERLDTQ